uniref:Pellino n=1 Tax=Heterorhabditis bacteriophora TaxID=37862 RepID=A0A1I7XVL9_HETBA
MSLHDHDSVSLDSRDIENSHVDVNDKAEIILPSSVIDDDDGKYGELILLGYNGSQDSKMSVPLKRHRTKMILIRRKQGNGIKKGSVSQVNVAAKDAPAVLDSSRHVVSYSYGKHQTVLVEYILDPNKDMFQELDEDDVPSLYVWREVSVDGDVYTLRETRSSNARGAMVPEETNMLQDGTLIDLCGATLLWRTADGLAKSPSANELEMALDRLNAGKPQCPVNLNTLIIPKKRSNNSTSSRQPYVYLNCGHVQGKHDWGFHSTLNGLPTFKCPICLAESERVIQLTMGMESSFHLDSGSLDYAFNPCGHVASFSTVRYWSRIPLPHGTNSFHPVCPFCTTLLATEKPFVRLIFQDHLFDN